MKNTTMVLKIAAMLLGAVAMTAQGGLGLNWSTPSG
jgi:hypothetical protein